MYVNHKTPGVTETFSKQPDGSWVRKVTAGGDTQCVERLAEFRLSTDGSFEFIESDGTVTFQTSSMRSIQLPSGEAFTYFSDMTGIVGIARVGPEKRINVEVLGKRNDGWFLRSGEYEVSVENVQIQPDGSYSYSMPDGKHISRSPQDRRPAAGPRATSAFDKVWTRYAPRADPR